MPIVRYSEENTSNDRSHKLFYVLFVGIVVLLIAAVVVLWRVSVQRSRVEAKKAEIVTVEGSKDISFGEEDITLSKKWALSSGFHPSVTFSARVNRIDNERFRVVFRYKIAGSGVWRSVDAKQLDGNGTYGVTIRDLEREMPYDCLFLVVKSDTVLNSNVVRYTVR